MVFSKIISKSSCLAIINNYGFTIHGSVAVPEPLTAVVPEVREMAGRTPYVFLTSV